MKIISLVENTSPMGLPTEHGLSLYIETERHRILFDTGQGDLFLQNAKKLGVALGEFDLCFLSHGHYDHGGGLLSFCRVNTSAPIYLSRKAFGPHYNASDRYIGLNQNWLADPDFTERLIYTEGDSPLDEQLSLLVPRSEKPYPAESGGLQIREGEALIPDSFAHEQYLMIEEAGKRVLFSGCSHQGILNIVSWFKPDVLIGGFHFMNLALDGTLEAYGRILQNSSTEYYTCHCTGWDQYLFLSSRMDHLHYLAEGESLLL
ncbi:MAG: MBL fold metallo-hydrolase [Lachnospiraceae bacterium]|nr:MBL fold metallo-hydrolase [Lachnospiraceae bacterium]